MIETIIVLLGYWRAGDKNMETTDVAFTSGANVVNRNSQQNLPPAV